jgi:hypothetical protein
MITAGKNEKNKMRGLQKFKILFVGLCTMEGPTQCLNVSGHHQRFPRQQSTLSATIYVQRV